MPRFTVALLETKVAEYNERLRDAGSNKRLEVGGRSGYTALDAYSVDAKGNRRDGCVDCTVGCGTPRECGNMAHSFYYDEINRIEREVINRKVAFADHVIEAICRGRVDMANIADLAASAGLLK